jgi:pilus assembly protein CpaC
MKSEQKWNKTKMVPNNRKSVGIHRRSLCLVVLIAGVFSHAFGQGAGTGAYGVKTLHYEVPLNKSVIVDLGQVVTKVSKGQPEIANVVLLRPHQILLQGKRLGTTNVLLWDQRNTVSSVLDVEVTHDLGSLKAKLYEVMPGERIEVRSSQGKIVLSGEISSLENMNAALKLADSFVPRKKTAAGEKEEETVVNLMHVGGAQQVMLEVKVAEIARSLLKRLDISFYAVNPSSKWTVGAVSGGASATDFINPEGLRVLQNVRGNPVGPVFDVLEPNPPSITAGGLFAGLISDTWLFNATIDAGKDNGLVKILAEPNLTTLTGQEASFLSGGEFPIPVPQGANQGITIEFKEFGVGVKFVPVVLDSGRINVKMNISVSELTDQAPVFVGVGDTSSTFFVPSLTLRKATSTLELADGQTMGIAGLISDTLRENIDKFPWLGDIPGLGALFRSQSFQKNESELVIFVTPRLARPIPPEMVRLPTDSFVEPDDVEFYLMGRLEGRNKGAQTPSAGPETASSADKERTSVSQDEFSAGAGGLEGQFGHQLTEE